MKHELHNAARHATQAVGWILSTDFSVEHGLDVDADVRRAEDDLASALQALATFKAERKAEGSK